MDGELRQRWKVTGDIEASIRHDHVKLSWRGVLQDDSRTQDKRVFFRSTFFWWHPASHREDHTYSSSPNEPASRSLSGSSAFPNGRLGTFSARSAPTVVHFLHPLLPHVSPQHLVSKSVRPMICCTVYLQAADAAGRYVSRTGTVALLPI